MHRPYNVVKHIFEDADEPKDLGEGKVSLPTPNTIQTVSKSPSNLFLNKYFQYSNLGS